MKPTKTCLLALSLMYTQFATLAPEALAQNKPTVPSKRPDGFAANVYAVLQKNEEFNQLSASGEAWQTDPIAFASMFYGANLDKRPAGKPGLEGKDEAYEYVDGKTVIWPALVKNNPIQAKDFMGRPSKPILMVPISKDGSLIILDSSNTLSEAAVGSWVGAKMKINGPTSAHGRCNAMISPDGSLFFMMAPHDLALIPVIQKPKDWPVLKGPLPGSLPVSVVNPNAFEVLVGLRSKDMGQDFQVPPQGEETVNIGSGSYDIFFHYSTDPDGIYQGDSFTLTESGVKITIVKVTNGNYGIRKVK